MQPPAPDEALRFLVIRRDNIGDLVCTTPVFTALRAAFPRARVCALVNTYNCTVLERNPDVDHIFAYTKAKHRRGMVERLRAYRDRARLVLALRREAFDYAILAGAPSRHALRFARLARPRHVIGYAGTATRGIDIPLPPPAPGTHEVEATLRLLAPLGIDGAPPPLRLLPDPAEVARFRARLAQPSRTLVGLHISARARDNLWPLDRFIELARSILRNHDIRVALFWSPGDASDPLYPGDDAGARELLAALRGLDVVPFPTHSVTELAAGIALCDRFIGCDGGAMHIAAALGKPVLGLYCERNRRHWGPWGVPHVLLTGRYVRDIPVADAVRDFQRLRELAPVNLRANV